MDRQYTIFKLPPSRCTLSKNGHCHRRLRTSRTLTVRQECVSTVTTATGIVDDGVNSFTWNPVRNFENPESLQLPYQKSSPEMTSY